jgi:uncharacterized cupin superfamily protein
MRVVLLSILSAAAMFARDPLAQRIRHNDTSRQRQTKSVHGGAGQMAFGAMLTASDFQSHLLFLHRGVLAPKSGIGQHFHNTMEEMFVILNGEAQFTIDPDVRHQRPGGRALPDGPFARHLQCDRSAGGVDERRGRDYEV